MGTWKHLRVILLVPGIVALVIPAGLLHLTALDALDLWQYAATRVGLPVLGGILICLGLVLTAATIRPKRFAWASRAVPR
jgi:hypothetical protein